MAETVKNRGHAPGKDSLYQMKMEFHRKPMSGNRLNPGQGINGCSPRSKSGTQGRDPGKKKHGNLDIEKKERQPGIGKKNSVTPEGHLRKG